MKTRPRGPAEHPAAKAAVWIVSIGVLWALALLTIGAVVRAYQWAF